MRHILKGTIVLGLIPKFILSTILLIISLFILLVVGISEYHIQNKNYIYTYAKIVDVKYVDGNYIHIYEFDTDNGTIQGEGFPASSKDEHIIGTTEEIAYNPKNPQQFDIGGQSDSNSNIIIGLIALIISIICIRSMIRIYKGASNYIDMAIK